MARDRCSRVVHLDPPAPVRAGPRWPRASAHGHAGGSHPRPPRSPSSPRCAPCLSPVWTVTPPASIPVTRGLPPVPSRRARPAPRAVFRGELLAEGGDEAITVDDDHPAPCAGSIREKSRFIRWARMASWPADLDTGRPATDDDERQPLVPGRGVARALGFLGRARRCGFRSSTASARVLRPGRRPPLVMPEVGGLRPAGDDQAVVVERARPGRGSPARAPRRSP